MPRRKTYKHGARVNFYIKRDVPQGMLDWMNSQTDLSLFVLHAIEELYKKVGDVDVAGLLPRNHVFRLEAPTSYLTRVSSTSTSSSLKSEAHLEEDQTEMRGTFTAKDQKEEAMKAIGRPNDKNDTTTWEGVEELDDPYA